MSSDQTSRAADAAEIIVTDMIAKHRQLAIPALIGACVLWAVENGGGDVVRGSLERAIDMSREMEVMRRSGTQ
jgi:hypothetical protein